MAPSMTKALVCLWLARINGRLRYRDGNDVEQNSLNVKQIANMTDA